MRLLILLIPLGVALSSTVVFAARDCLRRRRSRYLPWPLWLMLIVVGWFLGAVVYYLWGRAPVPDFAIAESRVLPSERAPS